MKKDDVCLVTGASGYLASWIARDLLEQGFRVRGTVRNMQDTQRNEKLRRILPGIELVAADLRHEAGWKAAVAGVQWVFHVASPQAVKSESDRTGGAVSGTRHLLAAAFAEPSVQKIVVTSSEAAIAYGHPPSKRTFTEDDWTNLDGVGKGADYFRSKTLAERLVWQSARDREINRRGVPVATVNPSFILGPSLVPWGRFSLQTLSDVATGKMPMMVDMRMHVVDVRDCARMHIAVMADPSSAGHRHLSMATTATFAEIARSIKRQFGDQGFNPPVRVAPPWLARVLALVSSEVRSIKSHIGTELTYDSLHPGIYAYEHRDVDAIVAASMGSMMAHGWLEPKGTAVARPVSATR